MNERDRIPEPKKPLVYLDLDNFIGTWFIVFPILLTVFVGIVIVCSWLAGHL